LKISGLPFDVFLQRNFVEKIKGAKKRRVTEQAKKYKNGEKFFHMQYPKKFINSLLYNTISFFNKRILIRIERFNSPR